MENREVIIGGIEQNSSARYTWKLINWYNLPEISSSGKFYVCGKKYEFIVRLHKKREGFYVLELFNSKRDVQLHVHGIVKFYDKNSRSLVLKSIFDFEYPASIFEGINEKCFSEITFIFSDIKDLSKATTENDRDDKEKSNDKQAKKEIDNEENARKLKQEEENINRIENESASSRDLNILSGDLKNAFLSEEDSDIIIRVGDQKYPAHKVIIRNRSSVFRAALQHQMAEKNEGVIDIKDCEPEIFKDFLSYLYTGKLDNISKENVFDLYYLSDKYDVSQVKFHCVDYIINNLSIDNICDVIAIATKHCEHDLLKQGIDFFTKYAEEIVLTVKWQEFMKENFTHANELIIKAFKNRPRK